MTAWLRALGGVLLALGFGFAGYTSTLAFTDEAYVQAREAYERHVDHPLFEAKYQAAAVRHYALLGSSVVSLLSGLVFSSLLFGLANVMGRLPPHH